jgi:glucose/arabinose dehydrogenase
VWVQGSPIHGTNGLNFGPDGNLYVASVWGLEIVVMDPDTGEIVDRLGPDDGGGGADDLAFGPDGSLYWTSILTGEVVRRAPDGTVTRQLVAPSVNPITFSVDGRLFVAKSIMDNYGLYELDPILVEPPRLLAEQGVNGMDWGADGFLYAPIPFEGRIVRIDITTDPATFETLVETTLPAVKFSHRRSACDNGPGPASAHRVEAKTSVAQLPSTWTIGFDGEGRLFVSATDGFIIDRRWNHPQRESRRVDPSGGCRSVGRCGVCGRLLVPARI